MTNSVEAIKYGDICDRCMHREYCDMAQFGGHVPPITACSKFKEKSHTNLDRIRSMTDEELAEWLTEVMFHCSNTICDENCPMYKCCCDQPVEDWLKQEAET